jgi:dolichol-phosphate mannosyltransferase
MPLQLWMQAWKLGLSIKEIPVELIYNNADKRFNGNLDNPTIRLNYYKEIINREMSEHLRNQVAV